MPFVFDFQFILIDILKHRTMSDFAIKVVFYFNYHRLFLNFSDVQKNKYASIYIYNWSGTTFKFISFIGFNFTVNNTHTFESFNRIIFNLYCNVRYNSKENVSLNNNNSYALHAHIVLINSYTTHIRVWFPSCFTCIVNEK